MGLDRRNEVPVTARGVTRCIVLALAGLLALGLALPAASGMTRGGGPRNQAQVREALRRHALTTLDGKSLSLADLEGEVVVLNFWATWCPPCRRELPLLEDLHQTLQPQGGRVIAIAIDMDGDKVRRFLRSRRIDLPAVHDGPDGLARELDLPHVPYTMVLDRRGYVVHETGRSDDAAVASTSAIAMRIAGEGARASAPAPGGAE